MKSGKKKLDNNKVAIGIHVSRRMREGLLILLWALAVFLLVALLSYHRGDPGWSMVGGDHRVTNAGGRAGAWFADLFLYIFGYPAYLFPILLAFSAWVVLLRGKSKTDDRVDKILLTSQVIGFFAVLFSCSALSSLMLNNLANNLPFSAGGIIGNVFAIRLLPYFSEVGTSLLWLAILLSGITLLTGLSWLRLLENLGKGSTSLFSWIIKACKWGYGKLTLALKAYGEKRAARAQQQPAAAQLTQQPVVEKPTIHKPIVVPSPQQEQIEEPREPKLSIIKAAKEKFSKTTADEDVPKVPTTGIKAVKHDGTLPSLSLLEQSQPDSDHGYDEEALEAMSRNVENKLADFGVQAQVVAVHPGPVVTRFELQLAPGIKVSKITGLAKDLARSLSMVSVRVVEVIPGKTSVGLELPNSKREVVRLTDVLAAKPYQQARSSLSLALGKDIAGQPVVVDLAKMPHLLVAGTTGSGKSVGVNAMLLSLLYKASPEQVRLIMIDPKMLELSIYDGIPHLLAPVVTDMKEAANALRWCVAEMERRYRLMAALGVRNLAGFNNKIRDAEKKGESVNDPLQPPQAGEQGVALSELPFIVVVIDEFADMMMVVGKKVEELIARIAQKARAAGIHLILATQRPSVDVITGLIKSNIPTRIAFQVSSKIDSRTILDQQGAEQLLGQGDMLYLPPGTGVPVRVHGAYVADQEVHNVVDDWKQRGEPAYLPDILEGARHVEVPGIGPAEGDEADKDTLYDDAVRFVTETRRASISSVQRRFKIGYNRAARLIEEMEATGVVSPMESNGSREVLAPPPPEM